MALADEGCEIPVEMIGLCWLRDSRRRMTQIRWERPNWTLMTPTFPDLPRPNRRDFSRVAHDVAHNHREAAKTGVLGAVRRRDDRLLACIRSVPPRQSCTSTASRAQCSPSSSAPGLQLHRARPARRLRSAVSGSRMPAGGGGKTRPIRATGSKPV